MKSEVMVELLENAAVQLGVRISYETLTTNLVQSGLRGGLCKLKGEWRLIVDKRASAEERIAAIATGLSRFDTSELELSDKVRETLRTYDSKKRTVAA